LDEGLREDVLPRVLLQMIETARPINPSLDLRAHLRRRAFDDVPHDARLFFVNAFDDARRAERACVARLAAASRVKRGAVERDGEASRPFVRDVEDARVELREMRVVIIEAFGHAHRCGVVES
jgi:hypothetical protein